MESLSSNNVDKVKESMKKDKTSMLIFLILVPLVIILVAGWSLVTGRAQSLQMHLAAWIALVCSIVAVIIDIFTYFTLPDRKVYNVPPGNIRLRFVIRVIEVAAIYYLAVPAVAVLGDRLLGLNKLVPPPYHWLGLVLLIPGMILGSWTSRTFFRVGQGTTIPFEPTQNVIKEGPFRYVRNPMILGSEIVIAGLTVILASYILLIVLLLIIILDHVYIVKVEENELEVRFGQPYLEYKNSVPRWIPRIPKTPKG